MIRNQVILILIPLILTSFTHLWNLGEFPVFHRDEGTYMRRSFIVLNGIGLQEKTGFYANAYDHPFFGQILLGTLLRVLGYPNFAMGQTTSSIELAISFPRIIMAVFSIIDTFLIFKICQRAYNIQIAFFASILFAVTPMTWLLRMVTLDTIGLPFLLTSVFVSLSLQEWNKTQNPHKHIFLVFLSGALLGIAIFTKIPFFTMIPLVGYLVHKNSAQFKSKLSLKMLAICLIPIFLIPSIWPLYAVSASQFDLFEKGLYTQTHKSEDRRSQVMPGLFNLDRILFCLGFAGLVYSFIKKDWIIILWIVPFLAFTYIHGWFHFLFGIMLLPGLCIAASKFVIELSQKINPPKMKKSIGVIVVCTIVAIGFFNTLSLVNQNLQASAIKVLSEGLEYSNKADGLNDNKKINDNITVIAPTEYSWIYKYIYKMNFAFDTALDIGPRKIETNKTVILQDSDIGNTFGEIKNKFSTFVLGLSKLRKICYIDVEWYKTNSQNPYRITIIPFENHSTINNTLFEVNGGVSDNPNPERIDTKNLTARYVNITVVEGTPNRIAPISDITIYGKRVQNDDHCKKIPIKIINFKDHSLLFKTLNNYDIVASYNKLLNNVKEVSKYRADNVPLNGFTRFFSPMQFDPMNLQLNANF